MVYRPDSELARYRLDSQLKSAGAHKTHALASGGAEKIATAETNLAALRIEAAITRALASAPKALTAEQVRKLSALLRNGASK